MAQPEPYDGGVHHTHSAIMIIPVPIFSIGKDTYWYNMKYDTLLVKNHTIDPPPDVKYSMFKLSGSQFGRLAKSATFGG